MLKLKRIKNTNNKCEYGTIILFANYVIISESRTINYK